MTSFPPEGETPQNPQQPSAPLYSDAPSNSAQPQPNPEFGAGDPAGSSGHMPEQPKKNKTGLYIGIGCGCLTVLLLVLALLGFIVFQVAKNADTRDNPRPSSSTVAPVDPSNKAGSPKAPSSDAPKSPAATASSDKQDPNAGSGSNQKSKPPVQSGNGGAVPQLGSDGKYHVKLYWTKSEADYSTLGYYNEENQMKIDRTKESSGVYEIAYPNGDETQSNSGIVVTVMSQDKSKMLKATCKAEDENGNVLDEKVVEEPGHATAVCLPFRNVF